MRAIRIRLGLRQGDLAAAANLSRSFVSKVERGQLRHSDLDKLERVCEALGADLDVRVRWRGEALDRLLDESHAGLVARVTSLLQRSGWQVAVEATFSHFGERGSVDILGWRAATRSLLIVEVKSVIVDAQGTLVPLDRKVRLGAVIAEPRGWHPTSVSRLLVVAAQTVNRRRVARLGPVFDAALPLRGVAVKAWLRQPVGTVAGLLFMPDAPPDGARRGTAGRLRVNRPRGVQTRRG